MINLKKHFKNTAVFIGTEDQILRASKLLKEKTEFNKHRKGQTGIYLKIYCDENVFNIFPEINFVVRDYEAQKIEVLLDILEPKKSLFRLFFG